MLRWVHHYGVTVQAIPEIVAVDRLSGGIVVRFADGSCFFYSASLLYATAPKAELLHENAVAW